MLYFIYIEKSSLKCILLSPVIFIFKCITTDFWQYVIITGGDIMKKESLLEDIEKLRKKLIRLKNNKNRFDQQVITTSQKLDDLLNEYMINWMSIKIIND